MKQLGIYVHIPFCKRKCYYCDFYSLCANDTLIEKYCNCLKQELKDVGEAIKQVERKEKTQIKTIYVGGGTPSFIGSNKIIQIMETIKKNYFVADDAEITIEVNPGSVTKEKLEDYKKIGINRLSIGMQSTNNYILKEIGRIHTWEEFLDTFKLARQIGFKNINIDCMIGLPNQQVKDVDITINKIIELNPEHVSVYSLIVEENTKLDKMLKNHEIELPSEETERIMYWNVKRKLEQSRIYTL